MNLFEGEVFHIFNQGNDRKTIFWNDENYNQFIWKMKMYLLPFGDFISWCLMPNHFHWQFYVKKLFVDHVTIAEHHAKIENERRRLKYKEKMIYKVPKPTSKSDQEKFRDLNQAIGLVQRTYTQSFNKLNGRSGSIFRQKCKAKTEFDISKFTSLFPLKDTIIGPDRNANYISKCFFYIHNNPVHANLVLHTTDWKYSSAGEYAGLVDNPICNIKLGREMVNL